MTHDTPPPRIVTLVLVNAAGTVLGALPPLEVDTPWWMDMAPVHRALQAHGGLRVTVLRLLEAEQAAPHGGAVSYLAMPESPWQLPALQPWQGTLADNPWRLPHARIGGPQADLAWARGVLAAQGLAIVGEPEQVRSWNLSSIWRLPTSNAPVWLKVVPPFFGHEGTLIATLKDTAVPRLLGHDGCRMLLAHIDGEDQHDAALPDCLAMIDLLVGLQARWLGRADALCALGLPDWRGPALTRDLTVLLARRGGELAPAVQGVLTAFVDTLPQRFVSIAACGLPDGLVHGDFHPGNVRGDGTRLTLLDWGDSGVGHPLLDQPAFLGCVPADGLEAARAHWAAAWQRRLPQADVAGAARLLAPVATARQALIYQRFLDRIEASEQPYHRADVTLWLQRTALRLADA